MYKSSPIVFDRASHELFQIDMGSPTSTGEDLTANTNPTASSLLRNRFSNVSLFSLRSLLPQYSEDPPGTPYQSATEEPPRYSLENIPNSKFEGDKRKFRYSYPIRPKKPWATLRLYTRDAVPGNSKPLQSQPRLPRFWSCDHVMGTVELDLSSSQSIQQIDIAV